jgi:hypothetical protein
MVARADYCHLLWGAIALTALALVFIVSNGEPNGRIFWHLLSVYDGPAAIAMTAVLVAGLLVGRKLGADGTWPRRLVLALERQRFVVAGVLWAVLMAASLVVYRSHPLSLDEYTAYFQAQVFSAGAMNGRFPPELIDRLVPPPFQNYFLIVNRATGAVSSAYWPGFSLLLAPFVAAGIPWACNPTLVAVSFLLIGRVAGDVLRFPGAPGWAMLFALGSPAFIINGISYYSMPAHLLFNLLYAWMLLSPSPQRLFLAGLTGGYALVLHNPFPHLVFAVPWIAWLAVRRLHGWRDLGWLALGYLPVVLLLGLGWMLWLQSLQAGAAAAPAAAVTGWVSAPALSALERVMGHVVALFDVLEWPDKNVVYARFGGLAKLWLWGAPLLLLLAWQGARGERDTAVRLLGASALLTFFAHFAIPFDQGHGWGYRYFHPALGTVPVLAAAGVLKLSGGSEGAVRPLPSLAVMALASVLFMNGLRLLQVDDFMARHLAQSPPVQGTGRQLLFLYGTGYYANDLIQNEPWLRGRTLVLLKRQDKEDAAIAARYLPGGFSVQRNAFGVSYFAAE